MSLVLMMRNVGTKYYITYNETAETGGGPHVFDPGSMMEPKESLRDNSPMFKHQHWHCL